MNNPIIGNLIIRARWKSRLMKLATPILGEKLNVGGGGGWKGDFVATVLVYGMTVRLV